MDFCIPVQEMQDIIIYLKPVLNRGSDELSNLLMIEAEKDGVVFSATNAVTSIKVKVDQDKVDVNQPGKLLAPAKQLISHLNTFTVWNGRSGTKDFRFSIKNDKFNIASETVYESGVKSKKSLDYRFLDPARFPSFPDFNGDPDFSLDVSYVKPVFKDVLTAVDPEANKEALRGAFLGLAEGGMTLVGTDGKRIIEFRDENISAPGGRAQILDYIFAASLPAVFKQEDLLDFKVEDKTIMVKCGNVTLRGKLIRQDFPDYTVYFENFQDQMTLNKLEFLDNLATALPLLNPDDHNRFIIKLVPGKILFQAENYKNECELSDSDHEFEEEFHVNGFLLDGCLKALHGNDLVMRWFTSDMTGYLIFETPDNPTVRSLVVTLKF
jgi:DNA polymerase III sliding clamp (beta) subunit (PCNA family)